MSGYDNPLTISYDLGLHNFGAGGLATAIRPPKGLKRGNVRDIHLDVRATFNQVTTPAYVRLGTTGVPAKYAELNCGAAAITDGYNLSNTPNAVQNVIDMDVDAISQVEVVLVAMTGGAPAGQAVVTIVIDWF